MAHEKNQPFAKLVKFGGFVWDDGNNSMLLLQEKIKKYIGRLGSHLEQWRKASRVDVKKVVCTLQHVIYICKEGPGHYHGQIAELRARASEGSGRFKTHHFSSDSMSDLKLWQSRLATSGDALATATTCGFAINFYGRL